jgi:hypothetical protein
VATTSIEIRQLGLSMTDAAREKRARRDAQRQGLWLKKARRGDEWYIVDPYRNTLLFTCFTLDQVEAWLHERES